MQPVVASLLVGVVGCLWWRFRGSGGAGRSSLTSGQQTCRACPRTRAIATATASLPSTRENANFSPLQLWAVHASESAQRRASRRLAIDVIAPAAARRAGGSRLCGDEDPLKDLLELKRICAQTGGGADDLRNAVNAMDQVSKKLLDAIGLVLSHLSHMHLRRPLRMAGLLAAFVDSCCATTPRL